jgi:hypothetical protein
VIEWEINTVNKRPELQLFDLQSEQIEISKNTISKKTITQGQCFCTGGWNPGLNMLDSFQTFTCSVQKPLGMCLIGINQKKKKMHYSFLRPSTTEKKPFTQYQSSIKGNGK